MQQLLFHRIGLNTRFMGGCLIGIAPAKVLENMDEGQPGLPCIVRKPNEAYSQYKWLGTAQKNSENVERSQSFGLVMR